MLGHDPDGLAKTRKKLAIRRKNKITTSRTRSGMKPALLGVAACAVLLLFCGMRAPMHSVQLLGVKEGAASWNRQEAGLWSRKAASSEGVSRPQHRRALLDRSARKLRQIVRGLRRHHLLPGLRQPMLAGRVKEAAGPAGLRVFEGRMLCAAGETSCTHPCSAFYTITGEEPPADCECKCTSPNPHSFYKDGSVICSCPGSPIKPENDLYPYPPGEGPAVPAASAEPAAASAEPVAQSAEPVAASAEPVAMPAAESEPAALATPATETPTGANRAAVSSQATAPVAGTAVAPAPAPVAGAPQMRAGFAPQLAAGQAAYTGVQQHAEALERDIDARLRAMGVRVVPLSAHGARARRAGRYPSYPFRLARVGTWRSPRQQGLWVGAPPALLPPDGDYPGGASGIPMDGYIAFDTGHASEPYHGTAAPMQEAGIADRVGGRGPASLWQRRGW